MYTLYYAPGACSLSVHITLEWIGAPYKLIRADLADPEYLKINPAGAVPALEMGGAAPLTQCAAILYYLAARHPEADLTVEGDLEAMADLHRWSSFLTGDLHPAFFPVFMPQRYTTSRDEAALNQVRDAGKILVNKKLAILDKHLQNHNYFIGSKRTVIDAYSVPMIRWAMSMLPNGLEDFPDLERHHKHMLADPSIHRAIGEEGLI